MSKEKVSEIETHQETNSQPETFQKETNTNTTRSKISFALENYIDLEDSSSNIDDCNIDFSDDSNLSELDEIDQQIFASARKGKLTLKEVTRLLSSRKRDIDVEDHHEDNQLVKIFCPFSFDFVYTPVKLAGSLKLLWSSGFETHDTHFVQHGPKIKILFSSITHANRFLKFCYTPDCSYLIEQHPQRLSWCN
jgi:hypothetical protein